MSYEISYAELEGNAKRAKALEDVVRYVGWEEFVRVSNILVIANPRPTLEDCHVMLPMIGVNGYPVRAWHELLFGQPVEPDHTALDHAASHLTLVVPEDRT